MLYQNKGDYDRAIADLDQAIDKGDPTAPKEPHVGANAVPRCLSSRSVMSSNPSPLMRYRGLR
jgi:hypothetical protein